MKKMILVLLILSGLYFVTASDAIFDNPLLVSVKAQTKTNCSFSTYIQDEDTTGTNIRAKADKNSAILKTIKDSSSVVAEITGFSNGWFEITMVQEVGDTDKVVFKGRGWIYSSLVGMSVAGPDPRLYAEPKKGSRILMKLKPDESPLKLIGCQGDWVKVETGGKIGWLSPDGQCGNPLTTCP